MTEKDKQDGPLSSVSSSLALVPITAIGASAGGLEPIEQFFDAMPPDTGSAFIIIQHLSPDFRSLMDELLARHSTMNIHRISDGMEIEPNCIYLNPPRSVMTIEGNHLLVDEISSKNTVYLPIDIFFNSLAKSRGADALGIVLSGTGSDGTLGSAQIHTEGGKILVQDPQSTRFDGMPRSVLSDGYATLVGVPQVLALSVQRILKGESTLDLEDSDREHIADPKADVLSMLKHTHGTDFLQYKEATIDRRIERRAHMHGISDISDYRDMLNTNALELQDLYADLLIEVTEFFRDKAAFDILRRRVLPDLTSHLKDGSALRVWVPGCASGEEAYSIAILLQEQARSMGIYLHLKIMATDIHIRSMNQASSGIYSEDALRNMPQELVERYFDCEDGQAQIKPMLRNMVFFSTHDVTLDPPFTRIDLISCRNLLIYLKEEAQDKVMKLLHFSLRKDGYLFLGPSEHIGSIAHEFEVINEKWRIYKKRRDVKLLASESIFQRTDIASNMSRSNSGLPRAQRAYSDDTIPFKRAHRAALESIVTTHAPPGFLLSEDGVVVHIFGNAGELIPLQSGSFSKRVVDLIRPDLRVVVSAALDHSKTANFESFRRVAYIRNDDQTGASYEVTLTPMELQGEAHRFQLLSIEKKISIDDSKQNDENLSVESFETFESTQALQQRVLMLEHNLQASEESLQSTIEELETSNEELQSTNEELMSTNEELQSTNEELHSVNEELYTVSAEHQRKNDELTERDTDIDALLKSSKIGTLHLDANLCLHRYTASARSVFNILPQDVGRPLNHITIRAFNHDIMELVERTSKFNESNETQVVIDDRVFLIRIMPYQERENQPSSVLLTVIDITDVEHIREELENLGVRYKDLIENTDSFFVQWDAKTENILYCNEAYAERWKSTVEHLTGKNIVELRVTKDRKTFRDSLLGLKPGEAKVDTLSTSLPDGTERTARIFTRAVSRDGKTIDSYHSNGYDCTDEVRYSASLDRLHNVFADDELAYDEKLSALLQVGMDFYDLDTALVSMIVGQDYTVKSIVGKKSESFKPGDVINLSDTFCNEFINAKQSLAVDDVTNSPLNGIPCHEFTKIESFVGAAVNTTHGPYGSVSFSSDIARGRPYSPQDEHFAMLLGGWIGLVLHNQEQMELMASQNEFYQSLFQTVPTMMFLSDKDGLIISASDLMSKNLGISANDLLGKRCLDVFKVKDQAAFTNALSTGSAKRLPVTLNKPDGTTLETELNCRTKDIGTLQNARMCVLVDVSERNKAFSDIEAQNRLLESANKNLNQFAFITSHDLQEPLRKIQQFSAFLEEDLADQLSKDTRYHLDVIQDASSRMRTLIKDLLSFCGTSQAELETEDISLDELLNEVISEYDLQISKANATVSLEGLPRVQGDRGMLKQLFINFISNSIKYRADARPLKIHIAGSGPEGQHGISITDNGIGFDMKYVDKIFEPFNRLHKNKEYKGSGIGLAICSTVCEKHGWTLSADGKQDIGCTFTVHF